MKWKVQIEGDKRSIVLAPESLGEAHILAAIINGERAKVDYDIKYTGTQLEGKIESLTLMFSENDTRSKQEKIAAPTSSIHSERIT